MHFWREWCCLCKSIKSLNLLRNLYILWRIWNHVLHWGTDLSAVYFHAMLFNKLWIVFSIVKNVLRQEKELPKWVILAETQVWLSHLHIRIGFEGFSFRLCKGWNPAFQWTCCRFIDVLVTKLGFSLLHITKILDLFLTLAIKIGFPRHCEMGVGGRITDFG